MSDYTNSNFWDCDCENNYIHSVNETECPLCGKDKFVAPDSIQAEIDNQYPVFKNINIGIDVINNKKAYDMLTFILDTMGIYYETESFTKNQMDGK